MWGYWSVVWHMTDSSERMRFHHDRHDYGDGDDDDDDDDGHYHHRHHK